MGGVECNEKLNFKIISPVAEDVSKFLLSSAQSASKVCCLRLALKPPRMRCCAVACPMPHATCLAAVFMFCLCLVNVLNINSLTLLSTLMKCTRSKRERERERD